MITQEIPVHLVLNLIISCPFLAILPLSSPRYQWQTSAHGDVQSTIRTVFTTSARITCPMASRNVGHVQSSWYILMFSSTCFPPCFTSETNDRMAHQSQLFGVKVLVRTQEMAGIPPRCFTSTWHNIPSFFITFPFHGQILGISPTFWSIFTWSTWKNGYQDISKSPPKPSAHCHSPFTCHNHSFSKQPSHSWILALA